MPWDELFELLNKGKKSNTQPLAIQGACKTKLYSNWMWLCLSGRPLNCGKDLGGSAFPWCHGNF